MSESFRGVLENSTVVDLQRDGHLWRSGIVTWRDDGSPCCDAYARLVLVEHYDGRPLWPASAKTGTDLRRETLRVVESYVCKDRQNAHGDAEDNFADIAELQTTYLRRRGLLVEGAKLESYDVAMLSALVKVARVAANPIMLDNWDDGAGYFVCGGGIARRLRQ